MIADAVARWHRVVNGDLVELENLLSDDVTFFSPISYVPHRGADIATLYIRETR